VRLVKAIMARHRMVFVAASGNAGLCSSVPRKGCGSNPVSFAVVAKTVYKVIYCKLRTLDLFASIILLRY